MLRFFDLCQQLGGLKWLHTRMPASAWMQQADHVRPSSTLARLGGMNKNQDWRLRSSKLLWEAGGSAAYCLEAPANDVPLGIRHVPIAEGFSFKTCADKSGQRFVRRHLEKEYFVLQDVDVGQCLSASPPSFDLHLGSCDDAEAATWSWLKDRQQVQHVASQFCLDAGDEIKAIIYPCHEPVAQQKQRFTLAEANASLGWVMLMDGWADNGRKRYFERCLDSRPEPSMEIGPKPCSAAKAAGYYWTEVAAFVPTERKIWTDFERQV